jgi:hypothetical protein
MMRRIFVRPSAWLIPVWLLLLVLAAWIYWPGIHGPLMFDDYRSVVALEGFDPASDNAFDFILADKSGPTGRPVSIATFVLENIYLDAGVEGRKTVNILLHLLNATLVFLLFNLLLGAANITAFRYFALLGAAAWLLSPLYVSTVLYVVQRMAMLATTFTLLALVSYSAWRVGVVRGVLGKGLLALTPVFILAGILSKENAVVGIPMVLLLEAFWFRFGHAIGRESQVARKMTLGMIVSGAIAALVYLAVNIGDIAASFSGRPFTLYERLLTQTRVLWDYLAQLLVPQVNRMGVIHDDMVVSSALTQPLSTLFAGLAWVFVLLVCAWLARTPRGCLLVFPVVFFLVGHSIESTILPLELYFEHRNYLPGLGVFLLCTIIAAGSVERWPEIRYPLLLWLGIYVGFLAVQTGSQVQVWSSQPLLRLNNVVSHPGSYRANLDMANQLASVGELNAALKYSALGHNLSVSSSSLAAESAGDWDDRDLALSCIANKPLPSLRLAQIGTRAENLIRRQAFALKALLRMLENDACPDFDWGAVSELMARSFLADDYPIRELPVIYLFLARMENILENYYLAYEYTSRYLSVRPDASVALLMQLHFSTALGKTDEAQQLLAQLQAMDDEGKLGETERGTLEIYLPH